MVKVFGQALALYFRNLIPIVILVSATALPIYIFQVCLLPPPNLCSPDEVYLFSKGTVIFIYSISTASIIYFLEYQSRNEKVSYRQLLREGARTWRRLAPTQLFVMLVLQLVTLIGVISIPYGYGRGYLVPWGIFYFYTIYSLSDLFVVIRGDERPEALQGSFELTRRHFWSVGACVIVVFAFTFGIDIGYNYFFSSVQGFYRPFFNFAFAYEQSLVLAFISVLEWCVYHHLTKSTGTDALNVAAPGIA